MVRRGRARHLLFAFSPISTRRRMAGDRAGASSCFDAQSSTASNTSCGRRIVTAGSRPVAGRPRLFWCTLIDLTIFMVYQKYRAVGSRHFQTGPNQPAHGRCKATTTAPAENEATPHQISAITGHTSRLRKLSATPRLRPKRRWQPRGWRSSNSEKSWAHQIQEWGFLEKQLNKIRGRFDGWRSLAESNRSLHRERVAS